MIPNRVSAAVLAALMMTVVAGCDAGGALGLSGSGHRPAPNGTPSDQYPAEHPALPQVLNLGGPVAASPSLVAVTWADDPNRASIDDFVSKIAASGYWDATMGEYGVGTPTTATVHLTASAPSTIADTAIETGLVSQLDGTHPEWPANAPGTIYLLFYPAGTTITGDGTSCEDYGAYHWYVQSGADKIAYAVIPTCDALPGETVFDGVTVSASHEIVEAATDPYDGGYMAVGPDFGVWELMMFGAEVGDMCQMIPDYGVTPSDLGYLVQRSWSNAAAAAGHDPCVPASGVYFNAAPVLSEHAEIPYGGGYSESTSAVKIPVGGSKTIELDLFSDGPTSGPFTVKAEDVASYFGAPQELTFELDGDRGENGQKLHLRIHVVRQGATVPGGEAFFVEATREGVTNLWPVYVTN